MKDFLPPAVGSVVLGDGYFSPRVEANHVSTIPASLRFCKSTGRIDAFRLEWKEGMDEGKKPHVYWDSDVAKVVEGMAYDLILHPEDKELRSSIGSLVSLIISAQQPDGYLNTHFTTVNPEGRFKSLAYEHELYCLGHLIEAAVACFHATGDSGFMDSMERYAGYVSSLFGTEEGKRRGYPGHEELELALFKLSKATGRGKYAALAQYFLEERGKKPNYYVEHEGVPESFLQNIQAGKTIRERKDAEGHAVRMLYLACGMADYARETKDGEILSRCDDIFRSISEKRSYITGGVGSTSAGEAFEADYNLPNLTAYAESCASMALVWFCQRMHNMTGSGKYADMLERALYNGALSGLSLSGDRFFYQNPLRSDGLSPYSRERTEWIGCSCCPTNYCRFLPQIGSFLWSSNCREVRLNIPAASTFREGGRVVKVSGSYPYDGNILIEFPDGGDFAFSLRIPSWCREWSLKIDGKSARPPISDGYASFPGPWSKSSRIELSLGMPVMAMRSNARIAENSGKVALARGPLVYALESVDNGESLQSVFIDAKGGFSLAEARGLPKGTLAIEGKGCRIERGGEDLYSDAPVEAVPCRITAIPYALWQNRGWSEMAVWINELPCAGAACNV